MRNLNKDKEKDKNSGIVLSMAPCKILWKGGRRVVCGGHWPWAWVMRVAWSGFGFGLCWKESRQKRGQEWLMIWGCGHGAAEDVGRRKAGDAVTRWIGWSPTGFPQGWHLPRCLCRVPLPLPLPLPCCLPWPRVYPVPYCTLCPLQRPAVSLW